MRKKTVCPIPVPEDLGDYLNLSSSGQYYERKPMIDFLIDTYLSGCNPLFVCGPPKSGKSIFAKELAWNLTKKKDYERNNKFRDRTYVLTYMGSIRKSICEYHIPGYVTLPEHWDASPEEVELEVFRDKMQLLRQYTHDGVFILENVNDTPLSQLTLDPAYCDLLSLGTVIIVSLDIETYPEYSIGMLPAEYQNGISRDLNKYSDEKRIILQNASLLPPTGISTLTFISIQGREHKQAVLELIGSGDLVESVTMGILPTDYPYSGSDNDYAAFLSKLQHRAKKKYTSQRTYDVICQCLKKAAAFLDDKDGTIARIAGALVKDRGDFISAFALYEQFLAKQLSLTPLDPIMLSEALYEVGCIRAYKALIGKGNNREALFSEAKEMLQQALIYQEEHLGSSSFNLAYTRLALAQMVAEERDFARADDLCSAAVSDLLSVVEEDDPCLADIYLNAASVYPGPFSQREVRLRYVEKALEIAEKWNLQDEVHSLAYAMMATSISALETEKRAEYSKKSLEILEKVTPHKRHSIYLEHKNRAYSAMHSNDYARQIQHLSIAINVLLEMLPLKHPRIILHQKELETAQSNLISCSDYH